MTALHCYGIYGNASFGLIVGSPAATSFAYNCNTARRGKANTTDFLLDMLSPSEASGKTFVILKPLRKLTPAIGLVIIINVAIAKNSFNVTKESVTSKDIELKEIECKELEGYAKGPLVIRSKLAVYVVLIQPSTCVQYDTVAELDGDASMTTIVPVELFFDIYVWSTPGLGKIVIKHYMTLIVPKNMETLIVLNERPLDELTQTEKETISSWDLVGIPLDAGIYELYSTPVIYFGCYVYGYAKGSGYMQVAGYMNGRLYDKNRNRICEKSAPKPGDLLDNDCDGKIDEEINNNLDDDGDSQIDEDLAKPNRINGAWTDWSAWTCSTDCKDHKMYRSRDCTNPAPQNEGTPCEGEEKEAKESDCYRNKLCPKDCGPGFWGEDCKFLCQNCEPDCEKFTGQCSNCKAGYKRPKERCNVGCEENEYGPNCLKNCTHKCGEDCADRIHGFCAKNILLYAPLMLILFLTPYVLLFCLRSRDRKIQKEEGEQKSKLVAIPETKSGSSEDSD
ncbi:uncharacterized protein LOC106080079 [Biomphalaria glabrata]|uniref:Uncharacterized protein LOC106080079 n=1 Tax=Biomphalaria glabrata TaxID=6526 RepID=A0A9W2ZF96_BIOGL|nr:uncharacterized protein LOC106080079 [Biomphalaria glabrata]